MKRKIALVENGQENLIPGFSDRQPGLSDPRDSPSLFSEDYLFFRRINSGSEANGGRITLFPFRFGLFSGMFRNLSMALDDTSNESCENLMFFIIPIHMFNKMKNRSRK